VADAHVILNPAAGGGAARRAREPLVRAFRRGGWAVELVVTERPGQATELAAQAVHDGAQRVIAVGGDGAVHEVANGLLAARASAAFGVVPIGTGNDFAKLTGVYRHSVDRAVSRLVTATTQRFDAGNVLGEFFVNTLGVGFGPAVVRARNAMPGLRGFLSYLVPVLRTFATFRPPLLAVRTDGHA
jgi:YegS/Rv2252/BmrU family lipid kinase